MKSKEYTPMIKQYLEIKQDYSDAIVFFRLGDFYEMFFDDAILASSILDITLTSRHKESKIPMCGVPYHSASIYIQKLIKEGMKVAIAEQVSSTGKGLFDRKVKRLITPGTVLEDTILESSNHNFIASVAFSESKISLAFMDISTGQGYVSEYDSLIEIEKKIKKEGIKELITSINIENGFEGLLISKITVPQTFKLPENHDYNNRFNFNAVKLCLYYVYKTQNHPISHLNKFEEEQKEKMKIDDNVVRHLDILNNISGNDLFKVLDHSKTPMGSRYLKRLLLAPVLSKKIIFERHKIIDSFQKEENLSTLFNELRKINDMYRILHRIAYQRANPKDINQLKNCINSVQNIQKILINFRNFLKNLGRNFPNLNNLLIFLNNSIVENPPTNINEGGFIKKGFDKELDELNVKSINFEKWLEMYLEEQKKITGIKQMKIGFHRVFGYFLEIPKSQMKYLDLNLKYERKQTLKNAERYTTEELRTNEDTIQNINNKKIKKELELFDSILKNIMNYYNDILISSKLISKIDVYSSLAIFFRKEKYIKPEITDSRNLIVLEARHPIVEKLTDFVKNDCELKENNIMLITGPNMSGKSTYMRMIALIIILAQAGLYVPAKKVKMPIYDGIFTRIGASDDISSGKSTFMMEMLETNEALRKSTSKSLLIFDEIGRGTATYDGMALAQGIIEHINESIKCHTMFSTHYHKLTFLDKKISNLFNVHVEAKKENDKMIFLYELKKGKTDKSYGIQVAALANLPKKLIKRSNEILLDLENEKSKNLPKKEIKIDENNQLLDSNFRRIMDKIKSTDINSTTPLKAMEILNELIKMKDNSENE